MSRSPTTTTISDSVTIATPATSVNMSRDPSLCSAMNRMCRVKSQVSNLDLNTGDLSDTFNTQSTFNDTQDTDMASFDASLSVSHVGGMADAVNSFSVSDFAKSSSLPFIAEHGIAMSRSGSAESNASSKSSRVSRRIQEVALSVRPIQPKEAGGEPMSHQPSSSSSSSYEMARVRFEDGSKVGIPKNRGYVRPTRDKVMCPNCNVKPEGFRGPHELRRHIDVVHAKTRKAFVCIDRSSDLMFLAKCKACKERKKYHAEYNAAAHLRRIHFNPKPKGAKGKKAAQGRGGNGGGDEPKLEILRLWFEEVEEVVTKDTPPIKDDDEEEDDPASFVPGSTPQELLFSGPDYEDYGSLSSGNNDATFGINFPCSSEQQQVYQPNDYTSASFSTAAATTSAIAIIHPQTAKSMFMWPNSATSHLDNIDSSNLSPDLSSFLPSNGDRLALSANETVSKADNLFEVSEDFDFSKSYDSPLYNASSFDELFTFNLSS